MPTTRPPSALGQHQTAAQQDEDERRARLWEDTIVLALRDVQWQVALSKQNASQADWPQLYRPSRIIKLDGRAESSLGDVALRTDHRFLLIEVKSTEERVKDEWWKGSFKAKKLYKRLATMVDAAKSSGGVASLMRDLSLRGHLVAFWDPGTNEGEIRLGNIELEPYLQAVIDSRTAESPVEPGMITDLSMPRVHPYLLEDPVDQFWCMDVFDLTNDQFLVGYVDPNTSVTARRSIGPIGLSREEFQAYVNYLTGTFGSAKNRPGEPINAVVQTVQHGFFQVVTTTKQLADILDSSFDYLPALTTLLEKQRAENERRLVEVTNSTVAADDGKKQGVKLKRWRRP
jgi:hypothetical protein